MGKYQIFLLLVGGGPQGTLLGLLEYIIQSNDNADSVPVEDKFKYIDDLSILHLILFSGLLTEFDVNNQVPSDIGVDQLFLRPNNFETQSCINEISKLTNDNLMRLNESKCNYMVFSRSSTEFVTRLHINDHLLERVESIKLLGMHITQDLSWDRNCQEICQRSYSRSSLLTKLKYAGISTEDLVEIYILFIRSIIEYCAVVYHSSLTVKQSDKLESIQKTCLRVILGDMYISYTAALEMTGLQTLYDRRQDRCLKFALKSTKIPLGKRLFPLNHVDNGRSIRSREKFKVNFARTEDYRKSTVPFCQQLLNQHFKSI